MTKILFVCHGNICRSTMAQYVFQDMVNKMDLADSFYIDSAATSREEIGNPVHYGTRRKLKEVGIPCGITAHARCAGRNTISSTILSGWTHGISGISAGS